MKKRVSPFVLVIIFLGLAFFGFADAVYLTASHFMDSLPVCTVIQGCDIVAMSEYSTIGPIPVSLLGVLFYTSMLFFGFVWIDIRKTAIFRLLPWVTIPAFLFSLLLLYLMHFVIEALCIYCILSAITTTLIMLISLYLRGLTRTLSSS